MKISVSERDIAAGKRGECCQCPLALAILRASKREFVAVSCASVLLDTCYEVPLPDEAMQFVKDFDMGENVSPFEFELPLEALK